MGRASMTVAIFTLSHIIPPPPPLPLPPHPSNQESSEEDLTVQGSDSSDESEEEIDDSASLASSVADLSSGRTTSFCSLTLLISFLLLYDIVSIHSLKWCVLQLIIQIDTYPFA